jgi:hypothetical protein
MSEEGVEAVREMSAVAVVSKSGLAVYGVSTNVEVEPV